MCKAFSWIRRKKFFVLSSMSRQKKVLISEIQGLRAFAVLSVLIYHIWPNILPGGYAGVDLFFVISGYLITGIILRDILKLGHVSYATFYLKRALRLLPAAGAVILSLLLLHSFYPTIYHNVIFVESLGSLFYYQNWHLSFQSIDYLGAQSIVSPLQHFWSLSVEEQYYLFWPLLITLSLLTLRKSALSFSAKVQVLVLTMTLASFLYSIYLSLTNQSFAYFNSFTRFWELGIGSLLAVTSFWRFLPEWMKYFSGLIGLLMILTSFFVLDEETLFPGYAAALPTIGCALVIVSSTSQKSYLYTRIITLNLLQFVGNISYSLYLWHWPIIIMVAASTDDEIPFLTGLAIIVTSLVFATLSKKYIEDTFRYTDTGNQIKKLLLVLALFVLIPCLLATLYIKTDFERIFQIQKLSSYENTTQLEFDLGYALKNLSDNLPVLYEDGCHANQKSSSHHDECSYNFGMKKDIVLYGDSHAAQWFPALNLIAKKYDYTLHSFTKSACAPSIRDVSKDGKLYDACIEWNKDVRRRIDSLNPHLILVSQSSSHKALTFGSIDSATTFADDHVAWAEGVSDDSHIIFIQDTYTLSEQPAECLSKNLDDISVCSYNAENLPDYSDPDSMNIASDSSNRIHLINMNTFICPNGVCSASDNLGILYRDTHHITAEFSERLSPDLEVMVSKYMNL